MPDVAKGGKNGKWKYESLLHSPHKHQRVLCMCVGDVWADFFQKNLSPFSFSKYKIIFLNLIRLKAYLDSASGE